VTSIVDDRLEVSVTADLNDLPQVRFATGSARILAVSHPDLDAAAALLQNADPSSRIEVQGYTDVRGDDDVNLELSQARADAVRSRLVRAGVPEEMLSAVGYGETTAFATGVGAEAYQANRLVRFQQIG
jgi:outer membrane protein OmpA-like peptidoglycan-associated protein